jgi:4-amino-4-deoxychorismate lyase
MSRLALVLLTRPSLEAEAHGDDAEPFRFADPHSAQLSALDLGATRGDGIFETISVAHGRLQALEPHLTRFARSAASLDLPAPDLDAWRAAVEAVAGTLGDVAEGWVKTAMTRGIEGDGRPTGWALAAESSDFTAARTQGVRVVTLDRGYRHDVERTSPWLLTGAKTLSYAVNRAVLREAARRGADDVIFVSSDGYVLEGPTSSVVYRRGDALLTPGTGLGILEGTTQGSLFALAEERGMRTGFELLTPAELAEADAIWLVSSVRHVAPVRELDGAARPVDAELTATMNAYLRDRVH